MGSKRKLLPQLLPLFPSKINTFYDVFGGSGIVSLNAPSKKVVYSDVFSEMIAYYEYLKSNPIEDSLQYIKDIIEKYELPNKENFYRLRDEYNEGIIERNPLMIFILNRFGFNGSMRKNALGAFNMSCGYLHRKNQLSNLPLLREVHRVLNEKDITFKCHSFKDLNLAIITQEDFIYLDPPYLITDLSNYGITWQEKEEIELLTFIEEILKRNIPFALSNIIETKGRINTLLRDFIKDHNLKAHSLHTQHAFQGANNRQVEEVLVTNY